MSHPLVQARTSDDGKQVEVTFFTPEGEYRHSALLTREDTDTLVDDLIDAMCGVMR